MKNSLLFFVIMLSPLISFAKEKNPFRLLIEGGVLTTFNQEIRGYRQSSATENWTSINPDLRLEASYSPIGLWKFGTSLQPIYATYQAPLANDLQYKGKIYKANDSGELTYLFPTFRLTANYPILGNTSQTSFLRLGLSAVARYAELRFRAGDQKFTDRNFLVIPLINFEMSTEIFSNWAFIASGDFLPGIDGNVFLDGLFDVFGGIRYLFKESATADLGLRLFFGGYDPKVPNDYANRIFFIAPVVRFGW